MISMPMFRVTVQTRVDDKISALNMVYDQTGGVFGSDGAKRCCLSVVADFIPELALILSSDTTIEGVSAKQIDPLPGNTWIHAVASTAGSRAAGALPANLALVLNLRNNQGLLDRPGRLFISGCSKSDLENGYFKSGFLDPTVTAFAAAMKQIEAGGGSDFTGDLVVWRTVQNGGELEVPYAVSVTDIDVSPAMGKQRRRKSKQFGSLA